MTNVPLRFQKEIMRQMPGMRHFAMNLCRNKPDAEDLAQETFLRAWSHADRFEPDTNMRAWLSTMLYRAWIDTKRLRAREEPLDDNMLDDEDGDKRRSWTDQAATAATQEGTIWFSEVDAAFTRLTEIHREVIGITVFGNVPHDEAALLLGCSEGTVKSRLSRARARLTKMVS